jgi:hypothetical protein
MTTLLHRFVLWCDDHLNPLLVKDLRQACLGWFFPGALLLFMLLQLLVLFLQLETEVQQESWRAGGEVFLALVNLLVFTTMGLLPMIMGYRVSQDFVPGEQDLFMITALTPRQIIHGKVLAAWVMTAMFYALHLPLATLTVFLRGVDFPTIFTILGAGFLYTGLIHLLVVMVVVGPMKEHSGGATLLGGGLFLYLLNGLFQGFIHVVRSGQAGGVLGLIAEYWPVLLILGFMAGASYEWAVAQVSPLSANRSRGLRVFVTVFLAVVYPVALWLSVRQGRGEPFGVWAMFTTVVMLLAFPVGASERMFPSRRVLEEIPAGWLGRLRGFLFASGVAGGLAWAVAMTGGLVVGFAAGCRLLEAIGVNRVYDQDAVWGFTGALLYSCNIALSGFLLRRLSLRLGLADEYGAHFPLGLFLVTGILPFTAMAVLELQAGDLFGLAYLSPFLAWHREHRAVVLWCQAGWALVVWGLFLPWFIEQWQAFRPSAAAGTAPVSSMAAGGDRGVAAREGQGPSAAGAGEVGHG